MKSLSRVKILLYRLFYYGAVGLDVISLTLFLTQSSPLWLLLLVFPGLPLALTGFILKQKCACPYCLLSGQPSEKKQTYYAALSVKKKEKSIRCPLCHQKITLR